MQYKKPAELRRRALGRKFLRGMSYEIRDRPKHSCDRLTTFPPDESLPASGQLSFGSPAASGKIGVRIPGLATVP